MRIKEEDYQRVHLRLSTKVYSDEVPATEDVDVIGFALQKQISKKVVKSTKYNSMRCPKCDGIVYASNHYCSQCGQKLDWRI